MAAIAAPFALFPPENCINVIHIAADRIKQGPLTRRLEVGDRRLDEMTSAIEFMPITQIRPAFLRLDLRKPHIEVAVGLLNTGNERNDLVHLLFERWVWMRRQAITRRLQPFGDFRFPEDVGDDALGV